MEIIVLKRAVDLICWFNLVNDSCDHVECCGPYGNPIDILRMSKSEFYGWLLFIHAAFEQFFIQFIVVLIVNRGNFLILLPWF